MVFVNFYFIGFFLEFFSVGADLTIREKRTHYNILHIAASYTGNAKVIEKLLEKADAQTGNFLINFRIILIFFSFF